MTTSPHAVPPRTDSDSTESLVAVEKLVVLHYQKLRQMAAMLLRHERPGHTLQATELVNEAALRLLKTGAVQHAHFLGRAFQQMRRNLVDHGRKHRSQKRDYGQRVEMGAALEVSTTDPTERLLCLHRMIQKLEQTHPDQAQVVQLRMAGFTVEEIADILRVSATTAKKRAHQAAVSMRKMSGEVFQ